MCDSSTADKPDGSQILGGKSTKLTRVFSKISTKSNVSHKFCDYYFLEISKVGFPCGLISRSTRTPKKFQKFFKKSSDLFSFFRKRFLPDLFQKCMRVLGGKAQQPCPFGDSQKFRDFFFGKFEKWGMKNAMLWGVSCVQKNIKKINKSDENGSC